MKTLVRKIDSDIFTTFFIYHLLPVFLPYFKLIATNIDSELLILFYIPFALFSSPSAFPAYIHSCIHTYIHASMQACIHSHIHACMCTCIHACMLAYIHTYMHTCIHTHIHTCLHACMHTYMHWFAIMVPHISAAYRECSYIFSTSRIGFHQFFSSVLCLINFHHCVIVFHFLCSSIFMSSSPVILLALSLHGLYSDICCHQCWSFVIVLFLGFIIFHIYIVAPPQVFCFKEIRKNPQEDHQTCKIPISILTLQMPFCIKNFNECRK